MWRSFNDILLSTVISSSSILSDLPVVDKTLDGLLFAELVLDRYVDSVNCFQSIMSWEDGIV
jgi:hypothetical protein